MKNMKRALRRHHMERLRRKRRKYWNAHAGSSDKALGLCLRTPRPCSCWMCGNQRRHFGPTVQELRTGGGRPSRCGSESLPKE